MRKLTLQRRPLTSVSAPAAALRGQRLPAPPVLREARPVQLAARDGATGAEARLQRAIRLGHRPERLVLGSPVALRPTGNAANSPLVQRTAWQWNAEKGEWVVIDETPSKFPEQEPLHAGRFDGQVYDGTLGMFFLDEGRFAEAKSEERKVGRPKRKREEGEEDYLSYFSSSSDDEATELDHQQKLEILAGRGWFKKQRLADREVPTENGGKLSLHDPRVRKIYAAHRATEGSEAVDISFQHLGFIGQQQVRFGEGTGHYVQPGGNPERPEGIKEPEGAYRDFFPKLVTLGNDHAVAPLFKAATGRDLKPNATLTDPDAATLALHYLNHNAKEIEVQLGKRTQLTEHLSKFAAIAGVAEQSRAFEAYDSRSKGEPEMPYDASLFIKRGLLEVSQSKHTLSEMFYQGPSGSTSIFLGAPTQDKGKRISGGAEQLRDPLGNEKALTRQMGLFSNNKKKFKEELNELRTATKITVPELSAEKIEESAKKKSAENLKAALSLTTKIEGIEIPEDVVEMNDFLNDRSGEIKKNEALIRKLTKDFWGDEVALVELKTAGRALDALKSKAEMAMNSFGRRRRR